jgi:signal transduction histidine kinase
MLSEVQGRDGLLSSVDALPDDRRAEAERDLVPLAREAALGRLAADVAHDVANPLFGVLGLVDLLLDDATPGSEDETRLRLLHQTTGEMKRTLQSLLDFARSTPGERTAGDLVAATRAALTLVRHGAGKSLAIDGQYDACELRVACDGDELIQAVLHLVLAARSQDAPIHVVVGDGALRVAPAAARDGLDVVVARRIALDNGGSLDEVDGAFELRLPAPE